MDLPGIRVDTLLPHWWEGLVASKQVMDVN
jgi:hypothetical protein